MTFLLAYFVFFKLIFRIFYSNLKSSSKFDFELMSKLSLISKFEIKFKNVFNIKFEIKFKLNFNIKI